MHGNYYGTSYDAVQQVVGRGRVCVLDIDVQGAQQVKKSALNEAPHERHDLPRRRASITPLRLPVFVNAPPCAAALLWSTPLDNHNAMPQP